MSSGGSSGSCTKTISGSQIEPALQSAAGGSTLCVNSSYTNEIDLNNINPSSNVTLQPVPGSNISLGWLNMYGGNGGISNITVTGFNLEGGVGATDTMTNLVFSTNTVDGNNGALGGFYFYGNGHQQSNIKIIGNTMLNFNSPNLGSSPVGGECAEIDGGSSLEHNFVFSNNTCGPNIAAHYTQIAGIDGLTEDNNRFIGPAGSEAFTIDTHNNVLHIFGDANNVDFSNNYMWHTDSEGQTILIQSGDFASVKLSNNLQVEDPKCQTNSECYSYAFSSCAINGFTYTNNTIIDSHWGVLFDNDAGDKSCGTRDANQTIQHNIFASPDGPPAGSELGFGDQGSSGVSFDYNVSDDGSAGQAGSKNYVQNWKPQFQDTEYYQPEGLPWNAGWTPPN